MGKVRSIPLDDEPSPPAALLSDTPPAPSSSSPFVPVCGSRQTMARTTTRMELARTMTRRALARELTALRRCKGASCRRARPAPPRP